MKVYNTFAANRDNGDALFMGVQNLTDMIFALLQLMDGAIAREADNFCLRVKTCQTCHLSLIAFYTLARLSMHLRRHAVPLTSSCFRWMLCMFTREFSFAALCRLWDAYMPDGGEGFPKLQCYLSVALLLKHR